MIKSDVFVFSDDVKFAKKNFQNYTNIKSTSGKILRLTVPVHFHEEKIKDIKIAEDDNWRRKIFESIKQSYSKSKYFEKYIEDVKEILTADYENLVDLNLKTIFFLKTAFKIQTKTVLGSVLSAEGHKDDRIINLCKKVNADIYYSGLGAKAYHVEENYKKNKICLKYTDYKPFVYNQPYYDFIPNLSSLDFLFNCGEDLPKEWFYGKK